MKKFSFCILFLSFTLTLSAQTKYMIYFKDKGNIQLNKITSEHLNLSEKSIERRSKVMKTLFTFEDIPVSEKYVKDLELKGIKIIHKLNWFNAVSAYLTDDQRAELEAADYVQKITGVRKFRSPKPEFKQSSEVNLQKSAGLDNFDFDYGPSITQTNLCDVPFVHSRFKAAGKGVVIGLLDSGFGWRKHRALQNLNIIDEWDFVNNDSSTYSLPGENEDSESHGTFSLSVMAGFDEGNLIGPAFQASFLLAKTEDINSETIVEEDNYAAGMEWMDRMGADIVSASLGYSVFDNPDDSYTYKDMDGKTAICTRANELAFERGILCVASAGNEGHEPWKYITAPADGFNTVSVGAVDFTNNLAYFSSLGPTYDGRIKPEVVALGVYVYGANPANNDYYFSNGTSFSCPMVAGIAAQIKSFYPGLTNVELRQKLINAGDNLDAPNNKRGYGLISVARALGAGDIEPVEMFKLQNPYPNPFTYTTIINFDSPEIKNGKVEVFNMLGQKVRILFDGQLEEGRNYFYWNGRNNSGDICASGVYIISVIANEEIFSKKVILIK